VFRSKIVDELLVVDERILDDGLGEDLGIARRQVAEAKDVTQ
jgi:hypothetical protein